MNSKCSPLSLRNFNLDISRNLRFIFFERFNFSISSGVASAGTVKFESISTLSSPRLSVTPFASTFRLIKFLALSVLRVCLRDVGGFANVSPPPPTLVGTFRPPFDFFFSDFGPSPIGFVDVIFIPRSFEFIIYYYFK